MATFTLTEQTARQLRAIHTGITRLADVKPEFQHLVVDQLSQGADQLSCKLNELKAAHPHIVNQRQYQLVRSQINSMMYFCDRWYETH